MKNSNAFATRHLLKLASRLLPAAMLSIALSVGGSSCSSSPKASGSSGSANGAKVSTGKESILTRDEAMYRSKQLRKITYNLWFHLDETGDEFQGRVSAVFDLREEADHFISTLRMDFTDGKIQTLRVNQQDWTRDKIADRYDGKRIEFKVSELLKGQNRIEIGFSHAYSKTGNGLNRFKDPTDGKIYFHTHLEPFYANLVFPCFDQPDLKASFETTVEAPDTWQVISNVAERDIAKVAGKNSWQFPPSPVFSTYLFALHAGPFKEWKADAEGIPLRLFARESEAKHVDPQNWFSVTRKGLEFFADFFGIPYPYGKYDQVIVPNLNAGAMENIAAVTFNEGFNFRSKPTSVQLQDRAETILHEMAHMWFGNLVTMRWWNGLWLNESFASYMAFVASQELKLSPHVKDEFFRGMKEWAYFDDSLVTNHPIEVSVLDTGQAFSIFDGITYGKGASALQQLHQYVGDEDFREGLHRYFQRFANKNTVLADLIQAIGHASDRDLSSWQRAWLQTKGTNRLQSRLRCTQGKVDDLMLVQTAPGEGNVLRPHQIDATFYTQAADGTLVRGKERFSITVKDAETRVADALGKPCPDLVFLNDGDLGYVKQIFSASDIEAFKKGLSRLQPALNRQMVWSNLRDGVRSGTVKATDYVEIAKKHLPREKSSELVTSIGSFLFSPTASTGSVLRIIPEAARSGFLKEWHQVALKQLAAAPRGSDLQVSWWRLALATVSDVESAKWAIDLASGKRKIPGLSLGTDRLYSLAQAAARVAPVPEELLTKLRQQDASEQSLVQNLKTQALQNDSEAKLEVFRIFTREKRVPTEWDHPARLRSVMRGFLHPMNEARTRAWTPIYLQKLQAVASEQDESYSEDFSDALYPALCDENQARKLSEAFGRMDLPHAVKKNLHENQQIDRECIQARSLLTAPVQNNLRQQAQP